MHCFVRLPRDVDDNSSMGLMELVLTYEFLNKPQKLEKNLPAFISLLPFRFFFFFFPITRKMENLFG